MSRNSRPDPLAERGRRLVRRGLRSVERIALEPDRFWLVTGSYRSGTTAVATWLGAQEGVSGFTESRLTIGAHAFLGEVRRFRKLAQRQEDLFGAARRMVLDGYATQRGGVLDSVVVDKEPLGPIELAERSYADYLADVEAMFPEARIVLMVRDPVATVWSMSQRGYGYSLTERDVRELTLDEHLTNWCAAADLAFERAGAANTHLCHFERLTADPAGESRRLGSFLGRQDLTSFEPRPTASDGFTSEERSAIASGTARQRAALRAVGLELGTGEPDR